MQSSQLAFHGPVRLICGLAIAIWASAAPAFERADVLRLLGLEHRLESAVIDPEGRFAYFGTDTDPGNIVKIDLATFERVDVLGLEFDLDFGEGYVYTGLMDPAGEYAYFATYEGSPRDTPPFLIRIDLATFKRAGSLQFEPGDEFVWTSVIDPEGKYAYFGNHTNPARIIKVDLENLERVGAIDLEDGERFLYASTIDPDGKFAYFGTDFTDPGKIIKVDLENFERVGSITLDSQYRGTRSAVMDPEGRYAYFGTQPIFGAAFPGGVLKVDLESFSMVDQLPLERSASTAASIDPAGEFAYFGNPRGAYKVALETLKLVAEIEMESAPHGLISSVIDPQGQFVYFGSTGFVESRVESRVVKIDTRNFELVDMLDTERGENFARTMVMDPDGDFAYVGTRGAITRIGLAGFERIEGTYVEPWSLIWGSAVMDPAGAFAYFGTASGNPGRIFKIELATLEVVGVVDLEPGEWALHSAVIDPDGKFAYFGTMTIPGRVLKIDLESFERAGAIELPSEEIRLGSATIDPAGKFAYFGTGTSPGRIIKIDLASFERMDAIVLPEGENSPGAALMHPDGQSAYFVASGIPSRVIKIDLIEFERESSIELEAEERFVRSAVMDPHGQFAYFAAWSSLGRIAKVDLASFERVDGIELEPNEAWLLGAAIDPAGEFAYFGMETFPAHVVKIRLTDAVPEPPEVSIATPEEGALFEVEAPVAVSAIYAASASVVCEVDFGDGTQINGIVEGDLCTGDHAYPEAGVFEITVRVADSFGGMGEDSVTVVVYDPSAGFVTGGGWTQVPAGSDLDHPDAAGRANFGFVARYRRGMSIPEGNLQFVFQAGDLNFRSTAMDWLVVTGEPRAQFRGAGMVNGSTTCRFEVNAWPGGMGEGAFGLKLYACESGADRFHLPPTLLEGGQIRIHQK